jgi:hypothetical protein
MFNYHGVDQHRADFAPVNASGESFLLRCYIRAFHNMQSLSVEFQGHAKSLLVNNYDNREK